MTARRDSRRGPANSRPLTWAPPTLTSPLTVTVTDDPATRYITLAAGQDLLLKMPTMIGSNYGGSVTADALVEIQGGRNVVVIGGHIRAVQTATTTMTAAVGTTETTIPVVSTAGFPTAGPLRIDGELVYYASVDATNFLGCTRDAGYFNDGALSSKTHKVGAKVNVGEGCRSGISFTNQTGTVHVEGLRIDGVLCDGIRFSGTNTTIAQMQNIRVGPTVSDDPGYSINGHPDCIQIWRGVLEARIDRATLISRQGKCFYNDTVSAYATGTIHMRDVEAYGLGDTVPLFTNSTAATVVYASNVWAKPTAGKAGAETNIAPYVSILRESEAPTEFVPEGTAGLSYVSPGYL